MFLFWKFEFNLKTRVRFEFEIELKIRVMYITIILIVLYWLYYINCERIKDFWFKVIYCRFYFQFVSFFFLNLPCFFWICLVSFEFALFLSFVDQFKDWLIHLHGEKMKLSKKEQMNNYKTRECKCGYQLIIEPCLIKCNYQSLSCVKKVRESTKRITTF